MQGPERRAGRDLGVGFKGGAARLVGVDADNCVRARIDLFDPVEMRLHDLGGGKGLPRDPGSKFARRARPELRHFHVSFPGAADETRCLVSVHKRQAIEFII